MSTPSIWVFSLLTACVVCFIANRPRTDVVMLIAMVLLVASGTLSLQEALAGFSDPTVIMVAAFFVIGEGLTRTGVAYRVGEWLVLRAGSSETRLLVLLMLSVALLGSVMSSTAVVAVFIPVVLGMAQRIGSTPGRLMLPLAYAGLMSGMLTLVGTPPNLVINGELARAGLEGFGFFGFTPAGLLVLGMGVAYMLAARRWLAERPQPLAAATQQRRRMQELAQAYQLSERTRRAQVEPDSPMVGQTPGALQLRTRHGVNIVAVEHPRRFGLDTLTTSASYEIAAGDILLLDFTPHRSPKEPLAFLRDMRLKELHMRSSYLTDTSQGIGLAEVTVPPDSASIGKTIVELRMRSQRGLNVMGLRRNGQSLGEHLLETRLRMGDTLLIAGTWKDIRLLHTQAHDLLVFSLPAELDEVAPAADRAPLALLALAITVGLMVTGAVPNAIAALVGCLLMAAFGCVNSEGAYRSLHWQSLILIVGMLPFAMALQKMGSIDTAVQALQGLMGETSPRAALTMMFALTAVVGLFISNTATAVLMAPVALSLAQHLGVSPYPFAMTVALAASAAFMTPVSSPLNTMVMGAGQYRFMDFVRLGVPFTLLVMAVCVTVLPWLFPFEV